MSEEEGAPHQHHHVFVGAEDDDWAWRRRIRSDPRLRVVYRAAVFVVGLVIVGGGLVLVPLPGPGWVIVFVGLAVWASEFDAAQRLMDWVRGWLRLWTEWVQAQPRWVQGLVALATAAFVLAVIWAVFKVSGLPGFVPDGIQAWLRDHAAL